MRCQRLAHEPRAADASAHQSASKACKWMAAHGLSRVATHPLRKEAALLQAQAGELQQASGFFRVSPD